MERTRNIFMKCAPIVVWTLMLANIYAIITYTIATQSVGGTTNTELMYYLDGLFLVVPLIILSWSVYKIKYIWQYLIFVAVLALGMYVLTFNFAIVFITLALCFARFLQRLRRDKSALDTINVVYIVVPIFCFVATSYNELVIIQKISLYTFVIMGFFTFAYTGIKRFINYVDLRKDKANIPINRLLNTGTQVFVILGMVLVLYIVPTIEMSYEFVTFSLNLNGETEYEYDTDDVYTYSDYSMDDDYSYLEEIGEASYNLDMLWNIVLFIIAAGTILLIGFIAFNMIRNLIYNFHNIEVDKQDVIESTFLDNDTKESTKKSSKKWQERLDFSYEMKVRRRYKKELKKYRPQEWQTPSEIEAMAQVDMPELHAEYERVRYSDLTQAK